MLAAGRAGEGRIGGAAVTREPRVDALHSVPPALHFGEVVQHWIEGVVTRDLLDGHERIGVADVEPKSIVDQRPYRADRVVGQFADEVFDLGDVALVLDQYNVVEQVMSDANA